MSLDIYPIMLLQVKVLWLSKKKNQGLRIKWLSLMRSVTWKYILVVHSIIANYRRYGTSSSIYNKVCDWIMINCECMHLNITIMCDVSMNWPYKDMHNHVEWIGHIMYLLYAEWIGEGDLIGRSHSLYQILPKAECLRRVSLFYLRRFVCLQESICALMTSVRKLQGQQ